MIFYKSDNLSNFYVQYKEVIADGYRREGLDGN